jgi:hypothetical protein
MESEILQKLKRLFLEHEAKEKSLLENPPVQVPKTGDSRSKDFTHKETGNQTVRHVDSFKLSEPPVSYGYFEKSKIICPRCKKEFYIYNLNGSHFEICPNPSCSQKFLCSDGKIIRTISYKEDFLIFKLGSSDLHVPDLAHAKYSPNENQLRVKARQELDEKARRESAAKAQRFREAAAQRQREAAAQREREAAAQREREAAAQREREAAARREREAAAQREREAATQREREAATQREREAAAQREREAAAQRVIVENNRLNNARQLQANPRRQDWQAFQSVIDRNNICSLYHFTDASNIPSIRQLGGLFSWYYCNQNGISIPVPGGDSLSRNLDSRKGLHNFVRVCFTSSHPMMYVAVKDRRISRPIVLHISPEIILLNGTKFANKNAASNDVLVGESLVDFNRIRFDIVSRRTHFDLDEEDKPYFQAEILVPIKIPLSFITNINNF